MNAVQIFYVQNTLVLRQKHSELVIIPQHVDNLKTLEDPKAFSQYFLEQALVNRSARKLFTAWLKKDSGLWKKIYETLERGEDELPKSAQEKA